MRWNGDSFRLSHLTRQRKPSRRDGETRTVNEECRRTTKAIYLVIDGEASKVVSWRVTKHIEACPDCLRRYEFERKLKQLIERACQCVGCPDGFEERLRRMILAEFE
ncbi:MAG: hypothetical protein C4319_02490 [Acidimicrobiia bacterium]